MHIVTVLRRPEPLEQAIARLARHQESSVYEARTRLAGELPRIVAILADRDAAESLVQKLLADGFVAAAVDAASVANDDTRDHVVSMAFGPEALTLTLRGERTREVLYGDLAAVLQGVRVGVSVTTEESKSKQFSPGRAILSGGLVMRKTVTVTNTRTAETREGFLYLYALDGGPPAAVYERRMHYGFLGSAIQPSSMANLLRVLEEIRKRAPHMRVDTRLTRPLGLGSVPLPPPGCDPAAWKIDLAAALFTLGL